MGALGRDHGGAGGVRQDAILQVSSIDAIDEDRAAVLLPMVMPPCDSTGCSR